MLPASEPTADSLLEGLGPQVEPPPAEAGEYRTAENTLASEARKALVTQLLGTVRDALGYWKPTFDRILSDQRFALGKQWETVGLSSRDQYTVNLVLRHIQQRVSALYAKNPKFVAKRKEKIDYTVWDGRPETIERVQEQLMLSAQGMPPDPNTLAIYQDFVRTAQRREMLERFGKTMELVFQHYLDEQVLPFKKMMKRLVRKTITTGVGYVMLDYQRVMDLAPETKRKIADCTAKLAQIEQLSRDLAEGQIDENSAEAETLRLMLEQMQQEEQVVVREGLVVDWPSTTAVIPDPKCSNLDGFIGADWVAVEYFLTPAQVKQIYDVDLQRAFTAYVPEPGKEKAFVASMSEHAKDVGLARVFLIFHKRDGLAYHVCEGFPDFLRDPAMPNVRLERFYPIFTLMFNEADSEECVFPPSDVELLRHQQMDFNRGRQGLREHRRANRPMTAVAAGRLTDEDKDKLINRPSTSIVELMGLNVGESVADLLQAVQHPPVDPTLYDTTPQFEDILRAVGTQEANLGGTSAATATESSIAESSRLSSLQSAVDDLDELLTEIARAAGQILLQEVSQRTVQTIVGPGAVWPEMTRAEIVEEMYLDVEAGSSGRPNQAAQIQNMERLLPLLIQIPSIKPTWLARHAIMRLDDKLDITEAFDPGLPSIVAMNSQKQVATGDPMNDPNAQGAQGGNNAPTPVGTEGDTPGQPGRPPMDPNLTLPDQSGMAVN